MSLRSDPSSTPSLTSNAVSTTQRVVEDLRQKIIEGEFQPGEKLKVEALKLKLNSGASPIREALSLLTSDQLVERIDQRGFRVAPASADHFREILMLRCQLDDIALRSSIERGETEWEEQLVLTHHHLAKEPRDNAQRWNLLHKEFHMVLLSACDSPILLRFCDQLYDLNIRYRYLAGRSGRYSQRDVAREHEDILHAAVSRDAARSAELLKNHYVLTGDFLVDQLEKL